MRSLQRNVGERALRFDLGLKDEARPLVGEQYLPRHAACAGARELRGRTVAIAVSRTACDDQNCRVQKQCPETPFGGREIGTAAEREMLLPGNFRKPTVAPGGTTTGADPAVEVGRLVRPDDDSAAVACAGGVGMDACTGSDARNPCIGHRRVGALVVTADEHRSAAEAARDVDGGGVQHRHRLAEHLHLTAATSR